MRTLRGPRTPGLSPGFPLPTGCLNCSKVSELTERLKALEAKVGEQRPPALSPPSCNPLCPLFELPPSGSLMGWADCLLAAWPHPALVCIWAPPSVPQCPPQEADVCSLVPSLQEAIKPPPMRPSLSEISHDTCDRPFVLYPAPPYHPSSSLKMKMLITHLKLPQGKKGFQNDKIRQYTRF